MNVKKLLEQKSEADPEELHQAIVIIDKKCLMLKQKALRAERQRKKLKGLYVELSHYLYEREGLEYGFGAFIPVESILEKEKKRKGKKAKKVIQI